MNSACDPESVFAWCKVGIFGIILLAGIYGVWIDPLEDIAVAVAFRVTEIWGGKINADEILVVTKVDSICRQY